MTQTDHVLGKLENALIDAGRTIDYPAMPPIAPQVQTRLSTRQFRATPRFAIAFALVIGLAFFAIPETRNSFLQWLGFGNSLASPLGTPTLALTALPNSTQSTTITSAPTPQPVTTQPTRAGTPSTLCSNCGSNNVDIRLLAKPIALPIESNQAK